MDLTVFGLTLGLTLGGCSAHRIVGADTDGGADAAMSAAGDHSGDSGAGSMGNDEGVDEDDGDSGLDDDNADTSGGATDDGWRLDTPGSGPSSDFGGGWTIILGVPGEAKSTHLFTLLSPTGEQDYESVLSALHIASPPMAGSTPTFHSVPPTMYGFASDSEGTLVIEHGDVSIPETALDNEPGYEIEWLRLELHREPGATYCGIATGEYGDNTSFTVDIGAIHGPLLPEEWFEMLDSCW